jgi:pyruvate-formate lyase-activating enzyme
MKTCNEETILEKIKQNGFLFDSLIISGGEFLINNLQEISNFLKRIRIVFNGIVIINTNGFYPDKMSVLCKEKLVDGFHLDIKLPPHIQLSPLIIKDIYGIETDINNVYKSANIIAKHNSQYSQFRTVKYPILDDEYFNEIKRYVNQVNQTHRSHIEWHLNEFVEGDSI